MEFQIEPLALSVVDQMAVRARARGHDLAAIIAQGVPVHARGDALRLRQLLVALVELAIEDPNQQAIMLALSVEPGAEDNARRRVMLDCRIGSDHARSDRRLARPPLALLRLTRKIDGSIAPGDPGWSLKVPIETGGEAADQWRLPASCQGLSMLVVAIERPVQRALSAQLSAWALPVVEAEDIDQASRLLAGAGYDGIFVPSAMVGDMRAALASVNRMEPAGSGHLITVAAMTELADSGAPDLLSPVHPSDLLALLRKIAAKRRANAPVVTPADQPAGKLAVLVVDDNPVNQMVTRALVEKRGHTVRVVGGGIDAVSAVATGKFDLVLLDVELPDIDGIEAARRIRALGGESAKVTIAAMTAGEGGEHRARCLDAGMDDYLTKPVDPVRLDALLERVGRC